MTRSNKMAAVLALFVALLLGTPAWAQDSDKLKAQQEIEKFRAKIAELELRLQILEKTTALDRKTLARQLARIEEGLDKLSNSTTARRAFSIDPTPRTGTGTIRLRNDMGVPATVTIEGEAYRIPPGEVVVLRDQPAGRINYYVTARGLRPGSLVRSRVNANETLTIRVYDPREFEE